MPLHGSGLSCGVRSVPGRLHRNDCISRSGPCPLFCRFHGYSCFRPGSDRNSCFPWKELRSLRRVCRLPRELPYRQTFLQKVFPPDLHCFFPGSRPEPVSDPGTVLLWDDRPGTDGGRRKILLNRTHYVRLCVPDGHPDRDVWIPVLLLQPVCPGKAVFFCHPVPGLCSCLWERSGSFRIQAWSDSEGPDSESSDPVVLPRLLWLRVSPEQERSEPGFPVPSELSGRPLLPVWQVQVPLPVSALREQTAAGPSLELPAAQHAPEVSLQKVRAAQLLPEYSPPLSQPLPV